MGKDQEFLEAARSGNITLVEKILNQKAKRSGPLASLRRGPGSNVQDSSGYSALHHAALNGHIDVVKVLLAHDASPNLPDNRGASPLHMAAWGGFQDIVKLFLTHLHRPANPNLQTIESETPLHYAAQHGHTGALTTLLAHGADPNVMNNRTETPLDLAAQYGRLQVVQMLIRAHPELLEPFKATTTTTTTTSGSGGTGSGTTVVTNQTTGTTTTSCSHRTMFNHTPLHLASRNGHKNVVEVLLAADVNVNLLTPAGTALHEAALCGKDSVVKTLLEFGADMNATDSENRTALDILEEFPPHVTKSIVSVINSHRNSHVYESESETTISDPRRHYGQQSSYYRHRNHYPHNKQQVSSNKNNLGSSYENSCSSPVHNYYSSSHHEMTSPSSSVGSLGPPSPRQRASSGDLSEYYESLDAKKKFKSTAPKKPPRRNLSVSPTHLNDGANRLGGVASGAGGGGFMSMSVDGYTPMGGGSRSGGSGSDTSTKVPTHHRGGSGGPVNYEYIFLAHTGNKKGNDRVHASNETSDSDYVQMMPKPEPRTSLAHSYENTTLKSYNPNRKLRRNRDNNYEVFSADFQSKQDNIKRECYRSTSPTNNSSSSTTTPQSPTNYQQPPTPEHPPPSAVHAEKFIHDRILPLNQEYRRRSEILQQTLLMTESGTSPPEPLCPSLCASSGSLSSSISISDRSVSTDCVEEFIGDVPFAGLFKGSTMTLNNASWSFPYQCRYQQPNYNYPDGSVVSGGSTISHPYNDYRMEFQQNRSLSFGGIITSTAASTERDIDETAAHRLTTTTTTAAGKTGHDKGRLQSFRSVDDYERSVGAESHDNLMNSACKEVKTVAADSSNNDIFSPFDEEEAWAKISEIMESFGSNILGDDRKHDADDWDGSGSTQADESTAMDNDSTRKLRRSGKFPSLGRFLREYQLQHLENVLVDSGFDNVDYLNGILDEHDLNSMNIAVQNDGRRLLDAIKSLATPQPLPSLQQLHQDRQQNNNNSILDIEQWLHDIHLPEYADIFKRHLCKNFEGHGCRVWEVELQTVLEINKIGHRKRILHSISNNRRHDSNATEAKDDLKETTKNRTAASAVIAAISTTATGTTSTTGAAPATTHPTTIRHNNKKNRPAPKPPLRATSLEIRAPSELLLGLPSNLRTQWRHAANALIASSVTYDVYYLGSTVVKELRGTESTRKSIQKLKRDNRPYSNGGSGSGGGGCGVNYNMTMNGTSAGGGSDMTTEFQLSSSNCIGQTRQRKQLVRLSISQRGVEFINTESHSTICEHEIRNINCACQAADDLSHFAYITKDIDMNIHYCHVFNADSMDLATEIILTLGQAFEVAYQLALREASSDNNLFRPSMLEVIK